MSVGGWFGVGGRFGKGGKRENPETAITHQIRGLLRTMRVPHFKHFGGPMSERGVPDLIGTLPGRVLPAVDTEEQALALAAKLVARSQPEGSPPGPAAGAQGWPAWALIALARRVVELEARGRPLWCEVKAGGGTVRPEQEEFLDKMRAAGAVAFPAWSARDLLRELTHAEFEPARRIDIQFKTEPKAGQNPPGKAAGA